MSTNVISDEDVDHFVVCMSGFPLIFWEGEMVDHENHPICYPHLELCWNADRSP